MLRYATAAPLTCLSFVICVGAHADTWLEVRTPSFLVVSNCPEGDARRVAMQFEQMRSVFHAVFPEADLNTATPIVVMAVADKQSLRALEPDEYLGTGKTNIAGLFLPAPEKTYVLVWVNASITHPYAPIYHEYAHFATSRTGEWTPLWLTEGLAEFYENTEITDGEASTGRGSPERQSLLEHNPLLPLPTLFAVDRHSSYYHEEDKASIFYAESWALTHYLKLKEVREGTHYIDDYLALLRKDVDPVTAAAQAFGDLNQLQADLHKYVVDGKYSFLPVDVATAVDDSSFMVRTLSEVEAKTARADFLAHDQRTCDARLLLESVLREDPANVSAREIMGNIALQQVKFDDAKRWCEEAVKLEGQSFFAHYCIGLAAVRKGGLDAVARASAQNHLRTAIRLNPAFAPSYDVLGILLTMGGKNLDDAYELLRTAVQLDPGIVEIRVDEAQVLMRMNRNKEATEVLNLALKMSHTPEQTAAVETVLQTVSKLETFQAKTSRGPTIRSVRPGGGAAASQPGVTPARVIYSLPPEYTDEARLAQRQGTCVVSLIVGIDGKPSNIVVTKKLGMGLDQKALEAVSKWKFEPARSYGRPVITQLTLSLEFNLVGTGSQKYFDLSQKAQAGDHAAELELAHAFLEGRDVPKDESHSLALLQRAADGGLPQAQYEMGEHMYGDGNTPGHYVDAYVWYGLAERSGFERSNSKITELEMRMTPEQLAEAHERLAKAAP
jgi:TonB family protein